MASLLRTLPTNSSVFVRRLHLFLRLAWESSVREAQLQPGSAFPDADIVRAEMPGPQPRFRRVEGVQAQCVIERSSPTFGKRSSPTDGRPSDKNLTDNSIFSWWSTSYALAHWAAGCHASE